MENQLLAAAPQAVPQTGASKRPRRFIIALVVVVAGLTAGEAFLQVRNYVKTGRSAAALASGETVVAFNEAYGVRTYRPNYTLSKPDPSYRFVTNSHGFRSPEIAPKRAPEEYRIIVAGASTVAGLYSKTNELTFPGQLESALRKSLTGSVNVVNAGVEGYKIADIETLVDRALIKQAPSMVMIYSGLNDLGAICGATRERKEKSWSMPVPALPHWIMTRQLLSKNTLALREAPIRLGIVDPAKYFPADYPATLDRIVAKLKGAGITPVLLTTARSYKGVPDAEAKKLAESTLFFHTCMDLDGLHKASEMFNQAVVEVGRRQNIQVIDLAATMPSGREYFVDANHFTQKGDRKAAELIHAALNGIVKH